MNAKVLLTTRLIVMIVSLLCPLSFTKPSLMKGVLDRFEDRDQAIVLIEAIDTELIMPKKDLPIGSRINMWFHIEVVNNEYRIKSIDYETTKREGDKSAEFLKKLRGK